MGFGLLSWKASWTVAWSSVTFDRETVLNVREGSRKALLSVFVSCAHPAYSDATTTTAARERTLRIWSWDVSTSSGIRRHPFGVGPLAGRTVARGRGRVVSVGWAVARALLRRITHARRTNRPFQPAPPIQATVPEGARAGGRVGEAGPLVS